MSYPEHLETEKAIYERWNHATHAKPFADICTDPEVMEFLGGPAAREYSLEGSRRCADHWETFGFGLWAVIEPDTGDLAGFAGGCFPLWHPEFARTPEIGWRLARWAWGRGYASTGGRLAIGALEDLGHAEIVSLIDPGNANSLAVARRLGLGLREHTTHPQRATPLDIYVVKDREPPEGGSLVAY